jgi:hypothetical protein
MGGVGAEPEDEGSLNAGTLSKEEITDKFTELFGEATVAALQDPLWKVRQRAAAGAAPHHPGCPARPAPSTIPHSFLLHSIGLL